MGIFLVFVLFNVRIRYWRVAKYTNWKLELSRLIWCTFGPKTGLAKFDMNNLTCPTTQFLTFFMRDLRFFDLLNFNVRYSRGAVYTNSKLKLLQFIWCTCGPKMDPTERVVKDSGATKPGFVSRNVWETRFLPIQTSYYWLCQTHSRLTSTANELKKSKLLFGILRNHCYPILKLKGKQKLKNYMHSGSSTLWE